MTHEEIAMSMLYVIVVPPVGITSQGGRLMQFMLFFLEQ
jgi:hypothetical protein